MNNNIVTEEQINKIMENADIKVKTVFGKCTIVTVQLKNRFIITESSAY